jgi:Leishmanolysin
MDAYGAAKQRWESIIVGNLPGRTPSLELNSTFACTGYPSRIDDLYICGREVVIDGPGRILGSTLPLYGRGTGVINPRTGIEYLVTLVVQMRFDTDDLNSLVRAGKLDSVMLHEMGHALGVGSLLWSLNGLYSEGSGVFNPGTRADIEWKAIGCLGLLPVELDRGIGTANSHWDKECLLDELMTGYIDLSGNRSEPLSNITIGTLEDMGYTVDFTQADPFTIEDLGQCGSFCPGAEGGRHETNEHRAQAILDSDKMYTIMSYAKTEMIEMHEAFLETNGDRNDGIKAVEEIFVLYEAEGKIYDFRITWAEVKDLDL